MSNGTIVKKEKNTVWKKIKQNKFLYLLFLPVIIYYIMFHYAPMFGIIVAFKKYNIFRGVWDSPWVGLEYFRQFFGSTYFFRLLRNTLMISLYDLIFNFPAPIILALLMNELKNGFFKKTVQTVSYLPHFISIVIIASMYVSFLQPSSGVINNIIERFGGDRIYFLADSRYFWGLFTAMNIWRSVGWGTIIYLAALAGVDMELYEACIVDGGGRLRQTISITLPSISPTIIIMLIFRVGSLLSVNSESILLMYNPTIYETSDVISTFVYRRGLLEADYSYSAAVGLFQAVIGLLLISGTNWLSKRYSETSLW